ncbi:MAG: hypothetical protein FD121_741 [Gallionellaceae bacterium]|nr:MAG: hypothetical protein FD121_741 [Gallionellaceae bacterium]
MKKVALSLASVLAAATFAQEASAIPSFARQTGMACNACHQQHFPVLNGFGQAFKAAGYTMMGSQEKVEGEHISLPATLNGSMLLKARYQMSTTTGAAADAVGGDTTNSGQWQIPDEFSLFFGGRVADADAMKIGFMFEGNTAGAMLVAGLKVPVVFDLGSVKLMAIPYLTDALGASYGFEQSSTGAVRGVRWAEHRKDISAQQYLNTDGAATGFAFVALHEMGYVNFSRYAPAFSAGAGAAQTLTANYLRVAVTPTIADWAINAGVQSWSGTVVAGGAGNATDIKPTATAIDFQAFGNVAGMETGVYSTYGKTATDSSSTAGFNADRNAFTVGADVSVIPHILHIGAAVRTATRNASTTKLKDNSITGTVVYDLAQNVALHVNHSIRSGDVADAGSTEKNLTTMMLEAAW